MDVAGARSVSKNSFNLLFSVPASRARTRTVIHMGHRCHNRRVVFKKVCEPKASVCGVKGHQAEQTWQKSNIIFMIVFLVVCNPVEIVVESESLFLLDSNEPF